MKPLQQYVYVVLYICRSHNGTHYGSDIYYVVLTFESAVEIL